MTGRNDRLPQVSVCEVCGLAFEQGAHTEAICRHCAASETPRSRGAEPTETRFHLGDDTTSPVQKVLMGLVIASVTLWVAALLLKGGDVPLDAIRPELAHEPVQVAPSDPSKFTFAYADEVYEVQPVADYELWGLVVSHNDIGSLWDSYHDDKSVDTKDLCVIWGENVATEDFHKVDFKSGSWTCYYRYPGGVRFSGSHLSNNHLVTDRPEVREAIEAVNIGDQVHFKGMLINYTNPSKWGGWWRKSSLTRNDAGNTACEVVFVNSLEVLARRTPFWYMTSRWAGWLVIGLLLVKLGLFVRRILNADTTGRT